MALAVLPGTSASADSSKDAFPPANGTTDATSASSCGIGGATMSGAHGATYTVQNDPAASVPTNPCRYITEWDGRLYGPTEAQIPRRTLIWVYAKAGEYIVTGSSELPRLTGSAADIVIWKATDIGAAIGDTTLGAAGSSPGNLDAVTNAQLDGISKWSCNSTNAIGTRAYTGTDAQKASRGALTTRQQEISGARAISATTGSGYVPCYYAVTTEGLYAVAFYGYAGASASGDSASTCTPQVIVPQACTSPSTAAGVFAKLTAGTGTRAWDVEVRGGQSATASTAGRVFTYAIAGYTIDIQRPTDFTYYVTTLDGYVYRVRTAGMDPNGFLVYGNAEGFLNDDGSPLNHDVLADPDAANAQVLSQIQGGVSIAMPEYPITVSGFTDGSTPRALSSDTLNWLHVPVSPTNPVLQSLEYEGALGEIDDYQSTYAGVGGTFHAVAGAAGQIQIVISSELAQDSTGACTTAIQPTDTRYWDPTNPCNSTLYRYVTDAEAQASRAASDPARIDIPWYGKMNNGAGWPVYSDPAKQHFPVRATLQGGPYHLPALDVESEVWGSPIVTLLNPPDSNGNGTINSADCPAYPDVDGDLSAPSCTRAFFNDLGYTTAWGGLKVGRGFNQASTTSRYALNDSSYICYDQSATNPAQNGASSLGVYPGSVSSTGVAGGFQSDPYTGFDTAAERRDRAFGSTASGTNSNEPCNIGANGASTAGDGRNASNAPSTLGDAAGLDMWTFFPSVVTSTEPDGTVTVIPEALNARDDGIYALTGNGADGPGGTHWTTGIIGCGNGSTSQSGMDPTCLLKNDDYASGSALTCQFATTQTGSVYANTGGNIFSSDGIDIGDIKLVSGNGATNGADPCAYAFQTGVSPTVAIAAGWYTANTRPSGCNNSNTVQYACLPNGSYSARYQLSDGTSTDTATITFTKGTVAVDDAAITRTGGVPVGGNVMKNDLCTAGGTSTVDWRSAATGTTNYSAWTVAPAMTGMTGNSTAAAYHDAIGLLNPPNSTGYTAAQAQTLLTGVSGTWNYTPSDSFSGTITRRYVTNHTTSCDNRLATVYITVVPVADPDTSAGPVNVQQTGNVLVTASGTNAAGVTTHMQGDHGLLAYAPTANTAAGSCPGSYSYEIATTNSTGGAANNCHINRVSNPIIALGAGDAVPAGCTPTAWVPAVCGVLEFQQPATGSTANPLAADSNSDGWVGLEAIQAMAAPASWLGTGNWRYTPPTDWAGRFQVGYAATGAGGDSPRTTLTITVTAPAAVPADDAGAGYEWDADHPQGTSLGNEPITGSLLANDQHVASVQSCTLDGTTPTESTGTAVLDLDPDGTYAYTPAAGWTGTAVYDCLVTGADGHDYHETLTLTVRPFLAIGLQKQGLGQSAWVGMAGSAWALYRDAGLTDLVTASGTTPSDFAAVTGQAGAWRIGWLVPGATYWLVETTAPTGFELRAQPIRFTVSEAVPGADDGLGAVALADAPQACPADTAGYDPDAALSACTIGPTSGAAGVLLIRDATHVVLPKTGGAGTAPFTLAGLGLLALSLALGAAATLRRRRLRTTTRSSSTIQ